MNARRSRVGRRSEPRPPAATPQPPTRPEPGPGSPARSGPPQRNPLPGPGSRAGAPGPNPGAPSPNPKGHDLRVVLVSRDNMLAGALRSLIVTPGGVRMLDWHSQELDAAIRHADVVIIDMPPNFHERTFAVIDGRFLGRVVVLLQEGEHAEALPPGPPRVVLYRPLQIGELWGAIAGATPPSPGPEPSGSAVELGEPEAEVQEPGVEPGEPGEARGEAEELEEGGEPGRLGVGRAAPEETGAEPAREPAVAADAPVEEAGDAADVEQPAEGLPVAESGRLIGLSGRELEPTVGPGQVAPGMDEATLERLHHWRSRARQPPPARSTPRQQRRSSPAREDARAARAGRAEARRTARAEASAARSARAEARRERSLQARAARAEARQAARAEAARAKATRAEEQEAARAQARQARAAAAEARQAERAAQAAARKVAREESRRAKAAEAEARRAAEEESRRARAAEAEVRKAAEEEARRAKAAAAEARQAERAAEAEAQKAAREEARRVQAAEAEARKAEREAEAAALKAARAASRQEKAVQEAARREEAAQAKAERAEARRAARVEAAQARAARAQARKAARAESRQARAENAEVRRAARAEARRASAAKAQERREQARQTSAARSQARQAARAEARQARATRAEERKAGRAEARQTRAVRAEQRRAAWAAKAEQRKAARVEAARARAARAEQRKAARAESRQARAAKAGQRRAAAREAYQARLAEAEVRKAAEAEARQARAAQAAAKRADSQQARAARAAEAAAKRADRAEARQASREEARQARAARAEARRTTRAEAGRARAARSEARQAARAEARSARAAKAEVRRAEHRQARATRAEARKLARAEAAQGRAVRAEARRAARAEAGQARAARAEARKIARGEARQARAARAEERRAARAEAGQARSEARRVARGEAQQVQAARAEARKVARGEARRVWERRVEEARRVLVGRGAAGLVGVGRGVRAGVGGLARPVVVVVVLAAVGLVAAGWRAGGGPDTLAGEVATVRAGGSAEGGLVAQDPRAGPIDPVHALAVGAWLRASEAGDSIEAAVRAARAPSRWMLAATVALTVLLSLLLMRVGPGTGAAAGPGPAPPQPADRSATFRRLAVAAIAGALVALDPLLVRGGRAATGTILALALALVALALAWAVPSRPVLRWLPAVGAAGGLALLVSPLALPVLAVPTVAALLEARYQEAWRTTAALGLAVGLWLLLPVWVAGQDLGAGQAGWLLGRPPGRGSLAASLAASPLTWLLVAAGLVAAILTWRPRSGARPAAAATQAARRLAWAATTTGGSLAAMALGYPVDRALPFAVPAAAGALAFATGSALAAAGSPRARRMVLAGVGVALAGLLVAQGVDWGSRYGGRADDGLGRLVATVAAQVPACSAVNAAGPDDRARLLAAGVAVTDFASGPAAHAAGVRYFVLTGDTGSGPARPDLAAWVRERGARLAGLPSRSFPGVELWRVDAAPLDPVADHLPVPGGIFSNVAGSACGGYRVVDRPEGAFHSGYVAAGGKAVLGRPLGTVWTSDGPALQAFDTMVLGAAPGDGGPPAVRPIELPPLLAKLNAEAMADADIPLPSARPPTTDRQARALLEDRMIARAYLGADPAGASAEDWRRARERFGRPLGRPQVMPDGAVRQPFERVVLELPADGGAARPAALGRLAVRLGLVPRQATRLEPVPGLPAGPAPTRLDPAPLVRWVAILTAVLALAGGLAALAVRRRRRPAAGGGEPGR